MDVNEQAGHNGVEYAAGKGIPVVVMEPIRGDALSNRPPEAVSKVWESSPFKRTPAEWALQWVWNQPEISMVLSGMSTMSQVVEYVAAADRSQPGKMMKDELETIEKVRQAYKKSVPIPCTGCRYCQPCPNGVEIPTIFDMYNEAAIHDNFSSVGMGCMVLSKD
jgi:predicted aldo/keto reductase-like oxidoreductase